jgi:ribosome-binding factor A
MIGGDGPNGNRSSRHGPVGYRTERIAEEIRNEVSLMLTGELKDPRLAIPLIVSEVRVVSGMRAVRVFVQLGGTRSERAEALAGLKAASGFIKHELVERLQLRRAPEIIFIVDESEEYGNHIDDLLRKVSSPEQKPEQKNE